MSKLCIIPARGGSKRLPDKNVTLLRGLPLINHSIKAAIEADIFDHIIITSDSEKILSVANTYLSNSEFNDYEVSVSVNLRPEELATDTSKVIDTVSYYYDQYCSQMKIDQVWLLLPTCPLRDSNDIKEVEKMLTPNLDGVLSITEMEFPPTLGLNKDDNNIITAYDDSDPWVNGNSRSQDHPMVYRPNGAIYAAWGDKFKNYRNFYKGKVKGYFMERDKSIDIDTKFEFDLAENMMKYGKKDSH